MAATRVYFYAESLSRTTSTTTNYSTVKVTLPFTPNASKTYAIFFSLLIDSNVAYAQVSSRLQNTTSSTTLWQCNEQFADVTAASSRRSDGGMVLHTDAGSGTAQTVELQVASDAGTTTLGCSEASILIVELINSIDIWNSSAGGLTASTQVYQSKLSVGPWTPGSTGDYLVFLSATVGAGTSGSSAYVRVNTGGTITNPHEDHTYIDVSTYSGYVGGAMLDTLSASTTSTLEVRAMDSPGSTTIRQAYGVALRLDEFDKYYTNYDASTHSTTVTTFADAASVTSGTAPDPVDYFILGYAQASNSAADFANPVALKVDINGSDVEATTAHIRAYGDGELMWMLVRKATGSGSSTTWKTRYARTTGTASCSSAYNAIAALQLEAGGPPPSTERWAPDTVAASTNLTGTGTIATIQDDPDSPDANWFTATSATSATDLRVTFPTPSGAPISSQNFRMWLRKTSGTATPTVDVSLYQGGTLRALLSDNTAITSTSGQIVQSNWTASQLVTVLDGSDVECRVEATIGSAVNLGALPALNATAGTLDTSATVAETVTVNIPAHTAGDLLVLHVLCRNSTNDGVLATINTAGWTQAGGAGNMYGGTQISRLGFGWKIGNGAETGVSITCTGGGTDRRLSRVYRFTAANGFDTTPVQNIGTATTGTGTTVTCPTVTPGGTTQNKLAVALFGNSVSSAAASATGESNGNWAETIAESNATNGTITIQTSDQSTGSTISGGTFSITSGNWVGIGFTVVPQQALTASTVEIGAIEWNVSYTAPAVMDNPMRKRVGGIPFVAMNLGVW